MVIIYRGNIKELKDDLRESQDALNNRYAEIFGRDKADYIAREADRLLPASSFFEDTSTTDKHTYEGPQSNPSNQMAIGALTDGLTREGRIKTNRTIPTATTMYISESGFANAHSSDFTDRQLASYVHEFNHFVQYALQNVPIVLVEFFGTLHLKPKHHPIQIDCYASELLQRDMAPETAKERLKVAGLIGIINELHEKGNRILDKLVLESIDIDVPIPWRHQERQYRTIAIPQVSRFDRPTIMQIPVGGDPFKDLDDHGAVRRLMEWETYMNPFTINPFTENLISSVKDARVQRMTFDEIQELHARELAREKREQKKKKLKKKKKKRK